MVPYWNPQDIRNPLRGDSKLPDQNQEDQEDQEAQGCPPSIINYT